MAAVSFQDILALKDKVNTELSQRPWDPTVVSRDFVWYREGEGKRERFEMDVLGSDAGSYEEMEQVQASAAELLEFQVVHEEFGMRPFKTIPKASKLGYVLVKLEENLPEVAAHSMRYYDPRVAAAMGLGQSQICAFDGLTYFNTAHYINPNRQYLGTFPNLFTGNDGRLDRAGVIRGLNALTQMKDFSGQLLNMPGRRVIIVGNEADYADAATIMNGEITAKSIGNAAASESNSLRGRADVILMPSLAKYDSDKAWYVGLVATDKHRPLCFSEVMKPTIMIEGLDINSHLAVTLNTTLYGWKSFAGVGYMYPQLLCKFIKP